MLIHVDSSAIAEAMDGSTSAAKAMACIDHLLCAHHEGDHVVSIAPEDIEALVSRSPRLSPDAFAVLNRIYAIAPEIFGLRDRLAWHLEVGIGATFDGGTYPRVGGGTVIRAGLHHFHPRRCTQQALVLGENATDAEFYVHIGRIALVMGGFGEIRLSVEHHGAAGSNFAAEFELFAEKGRMLLAIADSDARSPKGAKGSTWNRLRSVAMGRPAFQRARVLDVREAENLISLDAYEAAIMRHEERDPRLFALKRLRPLSETERAHADLKEGITLFHVEHVMKEGSEEKELWSKASRRLKRDTCQRSSREQCREREQCTCFVVDAISRGILQDVVAWLRDEPEERAAGRLGLPDNARLNSLGEEIVAWGCALWPLLT